MKLEKKLFCSASLFAAFPLCLIAATPSPAEIMRYSENSARQLIYGTGFENPKDPSVKLGYGFRYAPTEGNNGNCALRCDRGKFNRGWNLQSVIKLPADKIMPGMKYRVEGKVKARGVRHITRPVPPASYRFLHVIYMDVKNPAKEVKDYLVVPFAKPPNGDEYQDFSYSFSGHEGAVPHIGLTLWVDFLGTMWFDDIRVYQEGVAAEAFLTYPACSTFFTDSGKYKIKIYVPGEYQSKIVLIELLSKGKTVRQQVVVPKNDWVSGDFGKGLPVGEGTLRITLADRKKKLRMRTIEIPINVRTPEKAPAGACPIDEDGFMLRDGKRFLPMGIFFAMPSNLREVHLKRIGKSPYNFIVDYSALAIAPAADNEKITALRKGLDRVHANNLKIVFSLIGFYVPGSNILKRGHWSGETTIPGWTAKLARSLKDHPAIMGYYLTDELSAEQLAVPTMMRHVINREDPYHPTFTLTNLPSELPGYAKSGDIVIYDPYPLGLRKTGSSFVNEKTAVLSSKGQLAGTPIWIAPQGFSWGTNGRNILNFKDYIVPDDSDMRSLMLLSLVEGAKGICMFRYPIPYQKANIDRYAKYGLQNYPENTWRDLQKAAGDVMKLEPYFISSAKVPAIRIENKGKAVVKARLWKAANGKLALVIVGTGGGPADAVITVSGCDRLKSEFKHTVSLGGGRYHFTSKDLASDMLFE